MRMAKLLLSTTTFLLIALGGLIWVASTALAAASGFTAMVATTLLPGLAQVYWICSVFAATGKVPEPLTSLCAIWLGLLVVFIYTRHYAMQRLVRQAG